MHDSPVKVWAFSIARNMHTLQIYIYAYTYRYIWLYTFIFRLYQHGSQVHFASVGAIEITHTTCGPAALFYRPILQYIGQLLF